MRTFSLLTFSGGIRRLIPRLASPATWAALLLLALFAPAAHAAPCTLTQVTGTVKDPSGIPYAGGTVQVFLVPAPPGTALCNGNAFSSPLGPPTALDSTGSFSLAVPSNSAITPSGTQWSFMINQSPGVAPPFGVGPVSFSVSITITGATQSVTTQLTAAALALTVPFSSGGGAPAGASGDVQIKATSTTFGAGHINDNGTTLSFSENVLASASENIGLKYGSSDSYCYVDSSGNDSYDGLSPGTAKLTIMACYDALPTQGGTISICAHGGAQVFATSTIGQGIWIAGLTDPNYSSLPAGWRQAKAVYFLGSCGNDASSEGDKPGVLVAAGNSVNPEIWLSSNGLASLAFENLFFTNFPPIAVQIGLDSNGNQTSTSGVVGVRFENVLTTVCTTSSGCGGPGWLIGGGDTFNLTLDHVNVSANSSATTGSDQQAAILVKPASVSNGAVGLAVLSNSVLAGGGFKFYQGTNGSGFTINHLLSEAIVGPTSGTGIATVWLAASSYSDVLVEDVTTSDQTNEVYDLRNDGAITAASSCTALGDFAAGIFGPCTILGTIGAPVSDPLVQGQTGFLAGRSFGFTTATQRQFGPAAVRWTNLAPTLSSSWTATQISGTTTVTQGLTALDGCTGAATPTSTCITGAASASNNSGSSTPIEFLQFLNASSISISVGDWFIGGFWQRQPGGGPTFAQISSAGSLTIAGSGNATSCSALNTQFTTDGDWEWVYQLCKVTAVGTTPAPVTLQAQFTGLISVEAYAPILIHIPTGQVSTNEAYEIANNLTSYNSSCAVATICGLSGTIGGSVAFSALTPGIDTNAGTYGFGAGTTFTLNNAGGFVAPSAASFVSTSTLQYGIATGADNVHFWNGASDLIDLGIASVPSNGDVLGALISGSTITAQDLGGVAGGGTKFLQYTPQGSGATFAAGNYIGGNGSNIAAELTPGLPPVNISASGTTVLLSSYRGEIVKASSTSGAQTFALPDGTTTGFTQNFYMRLCNHGTVGPLTLTNNGGSYTFSGAASPYSLPEGYCTDISNNSTSTGWTLSNAPGLLSAGPGVGLTQTQYGTTLFSTPPYVAAAGSVNVLTGAYSPAITSPLLVAGLELYFLPNLANTTTTPTFNPNGLGAATITKLGTAALAASDLTTTAIADVIYDGTRWQLQNPQTASGSSGLSGMTAGQVPIAATASTVTSSKALVGSDAGIATAGTISATAGTLTCSDSNGGVTTTGCPASLPAVTNTTAVTVSNPTAATDTILMAISLPAGYLNTAGQPFIVHGSGVLSTTTASVPQVTITPKLCSVAGCATGTVTPLAAIQSAALNSVAISNATWAIDLTMSVVGTGSSCNLIVKGSPGLIIEAGASVATADSVYADSNTAVSSPNQNCANALFLDFFVQQSTTGASNSYKQLEAVIAPPSGIGGSCTFTGDGLFDSSTPSGSCTASVATQAAGTMFVGSTNNAVPQTGASAAAPTAQVTPEPLFMQDPRSWAVFYDDFNCFNVSSTNVGCQQWGVSGTGGTASVFTGSGAGAYFGAETCSAAATASDQCNLITQTFSMGQLNFANVTEGDILIRVKLASTANINFFAGTVDQNSGKGETAPAYLGIAYNVGKSDTGWMCVVNNGTPTRTAISGTLDATTFHTFRIRWKGAKTIACSEDGGTETSLAATNFPTDTAEGPEMEVDNNGTANVAAFAVDYFVMNLGGVPR